jgi:hypothetical protein
MKKQSAQVMLHACQGTDRCCHRGCSSVAPGCNHPPPPTWCSSGGFHSTKSLGPCGLPSSSTTAPMQPTIQPGGDADTHTVSLAWAVHPLMLLAALQYGTTAPWAGPALQCKCSSGAGSKRICPAAATAGATGVNRPQHPFTLQAEVQTAVHTFHLRHPQQLLSMLPRVGHSGCGDCKGGLHGTRKGEGNVSAAHPPASDGMQNISIETHELTWLWYTRSHRRRRRRSTRAVWHPNTPAAAAGGGSSMRGCGTRRGTLVWARLNGRARTEAGAAVPTHLCRHGPRPPPHTAGWPAAACSVSYSEIQFETVRYRETCIIASEQRQWRRHPTAMQLAPSATIWPHKACTECAGCTGYSAAQPIAAHPPTQTAGAPAARSCAACLGL